MWMQKELGSLFLGSFLVHQKRLELVSYIENSGVKHKKSQKILSSVKVSNWMLCSSQIIKLSKKGNQCVLTWLVCFLNTEAGTYSVYLCAHAIIYKAWQMILPTKTLEELFSNRPHLKWSSEDRSSEISVHLT